MQRERVAKIIQSVFVSCSVLRRQITKAIEHFFLLSIAGGGLFLLLNVHCLP